MTRIKRLFLFVLTPVLVVLAAFGLYQRDPTPLDEATFAALYTDPAPAPDGPRKLFHLGHSLIGHDMPAMLMQLAPAGHDYNNQLGWGAPLRQHWDPEEPINGFDAENNHARYRDAHEAVGSGDYDALVLTEMVELEAAIDYFSAARMLFNWADKAQGQGTPVYFYETWHELDDPKGWRARLDSDLPKNWEGRIMRPALAMMDTPEPIYLIPGGQVMAAVADRLEAEGPVGPVSSYRDLFSDEIHFNDYGAYLMALTHYAVLYQQDPTGLPHRLRRFDGTPADDPGPELAAFFQRIVWKVVTSMPRTGVPS